MSLEPTTTTLIRLVEESREQRCTHPLLKHLVLGAVQDALRQESPDRYFEKCHVAAISIFEILNTLPIRSTVCGGTASWKFVGVDGSGTERTFKGGFFVSNTELPCPHYWLLTEFGERVDLVSSYYHLAISGQLAGYRSHDILPAVWMKEADLAGLRNVEYSVAERWNKVNLKDCDEMARSVVARAAAAFQAKTNVPAQNDQAARFDGLLLLKPEDLAELRKTNNWVLRNLGCT